MEFAVFDDSNNGDQNDLAGMNLADAFKKKMGGSEII